MDEIVRQIQVEKDHAKFSKLVQELTALIAQKEHRFPPENPQQR
jgi:hypothetical protein